MARGAYIRGPRQYARPPEPLVEARPRAPARPPWRAGRSPVAFSVDHGARATGVVREAEPSAGISYRRGATLLSTLIGVTGLLTYAFHSLTAHALGRDAYGVIGVLWATVFLTASVIYRPVEQLLSRTLAERQARGWRVGSALRVAATIQLGLAFGFTVVALALQANDRARALLGERDALLVLRGRRALLRRQLLRARLSCRAAALWAVWRPRHAGVGVARRLRSLADHGGHRRRERRGGRDRRRPAVEPGRSCRGRSAVR